METKIHEALEGQPRIAEADRILRSCVHCGFCTATCPTYQMFGDELDSPRGRIYLLKDLIETNEISDKAVRHIDRCLTCRSCETTCPSGVQYNRLLDIGRELIVERVDRPLADRLKMFVLKHLVPRPAIFGFFLRIGHIARSILPFLTIVPPRFPVEDWGRIDRENSKRRVVVLQGCVQRAMTPNVNKALEYLLSRHDIAVDYLAEESCCGAVELHLSDDEAGKARMRTMVDRLLPFVESGTTVISTATGCASTIKEYDLALADDPAYREKAERVSAHLTDVSEFLYGLAFEAAPRRVAYQVPCSLQHGQKLRGTVEHVLEGAGLTLLPVAESHLCCGSAGTYSFMHPGPANDLRMRKLKALGQYEPEVIATANVGCQVHLQEKSDVPVLHWVELLALQVSVLEDPPE
jgi:glycolate oxidase iron-sulfur subunit